MFNQRLRVEQGSFRGASHALMVANTLPCADAPGIRAFPGALTAQDGVSRTIAVVFISHHISTQPTTSQPARVHYRFFTDHLSAR